MKLWMITGSSTDDGAPIYLRTDGSWTRALVEGAVLESEASRDEALAEARQRERAVCDPYVIVVSRDASGQPGPTSLRERIRAEGPTITLPCAAKPARAGERQASA
ncbi:DUF2849 domain-containing protein [Pseudenhygromyxa sp. WMMC2535]|uniref:DUF2849 domain-containing protein n=1 Tax=Pseudenhygromyxa sp. WMMC2535 TaxID=2712867 RepID=UPI00159624EA|nr:DUF2849 domain-containing protein [Pseudenhygromyxa sp. WMMC2535]NVB43273.1 DUF2849 domain-containing protein [Pseudenhygromyxa sp. WMMC2535]